MSTYVFKDFKPRGQAWPWMTVWWFLTGQLDHWNGYVVSVDEAWRVLERHDAEAVAWWRENVPHLAGTEFVFPIGSCELA